MEVLAKIFVRLEQYNVRLNPKKCVFGVTSGKFLGYIVSCRDIEVDPMKVKAIMEMPPLTNLSQLHSLQGKLLSIRRFIAQLAYKCQPFQHLLDKGVIFRWDAKFQEAFQQLKDYLMSLLVLMPPIDGKPFVLYISATSSILRALLTHHNYSRKERDIYYISHTLVGYELNYTPMERACLIVIFVTQKLWHYMQSHQIKLVAKIDPLKYLLIKDALTRRLSKWVMILSEFGIEYIERKAIKGQVITHQLADAPIVLDHPLVIDILDESIFTMTSSTQWKLYFDVSFNHHGS